MGIRENYEAILESIRRAESAAKREAGEVTLIAVSKTKPMEDLREAYAAGAREFGENRVQELIEKIPQMPDDVHWHMIGHLQTNKVKYLIGKNVLIHSVDSLRLAEEISRHSVREGMTTEILVEVNVAGEESKSGADPAGAVALAADILALPGLCVRGLMTVAPICRDPEENRGVFRTLRELRDEILKNGIDRSEEKKDNRTCGLSRFSELSMGMTGDYEAAILEGATFVRVGTGIFGERVRKR